MTFWKQELGTRKHRRLEVFEIWGYRKLSRVKWIDKITSEEVLERLREEQSLWRSIIKGRDFGAYFEAPGLVLT